MKSKKGIGIFSLLNVLTAVFVGLKLGQVITWSWWKVLLPTLIPIGFVIFIFTILILVMIIRDMLEIVDNPKL